MALGDQAVPFLSNLADTYDRISSDLSRLGSAQVAPRVPGAVRPPPPGVSPAPAQQDTAEPFSLKLDEDVWGDEQAKSLKTPLDTEINRLRGQIQNLEEAANARQEAQMQAQIDGYFDRANVYGTGGGENTWDAGAVDYVLSQFGTWL